MSDRKLDKNVSMHLKHAESTTKSAFFFSSLAWVKPLNEWMLQFNGKKLVMLQIRINYWMVVKQISTIPMFQSFFLLFVNCAPVIASPIHHASTSIQLIRFVVHHVRLRKQEPTDKPKHNPQSMPNTCTIHRISSPFL